MRAPRFLQIGWVAADLLSKAAFENLRKVSPEDSDLPRRVRAALERLGPTFVKLGQALSLRRDFLSDRYLTSLRDLQDRVGPFPAQQARDEVERSLGRKVEEIFESFEMEPMAAGSVAQVHRARLLDSRPVVVKIRRPDIREQIDRDMKVLLRLTRVVVALSRRLARLQPRALIQEIWDNLRRETDFRQEAQSIRQFAGAFDAQAGIFVPNVIDGLYAESVLVQEMSGGRRIDDPTVVASDGQRLARILVDTYLVQIFRLGRFHGDPHPGNLFVMEDGRLCFHDFGLVGRLDWNSRRALVSFLQAFVRQDPAWTLDAAIDLKLLGGALDRAALIAGLDAILSDYSTRPLKDWSIAEAVLRVARLGSGENFLVPHNLMVLMRAVFLVESALRTLDPAFEVLDTLITRGETMMSDMLRDASMAGAFHRLKVEAALTAQDLPSLVASWLHQAQTDGGNPVIPVRTEGLEDLKAHLDRTGNRLATGMIAVGLYIASSVLVLHGPGPHVRGDFPLLAVFGYAAALWLSWRLLRAIRRSGRL